MPEAPINTAFNRNQWFWIRVPKFLFVSPSSSPMMQVRYKESAQQARAATMIRFKAAARLCCTVADECSSDGCSQDQP